MKYLFVSISIMLLSANYLWSQDQYENLVFEGAGIRGIAYAGVIMQMEEFGLVEDIKKVGGTSAGAITAMMLSIGYSSEEIYQIVSETRFQRSNKGGWGVFGGIHRMKKRYGWYKGKKIEKWLEEKIEAKTGDPDITFRELKERGYKELYITATCLNRQELIIFSASTYPEMKIKDAVKVSMSIPLYFEANFMDSSGTLYKHPDGRENLDIVVDGGIIANFPIELFDEYVVDSTGEEHRIPNPKTLGIRMDSEDQIENDKKDLGLAEKEISDLRSYIEALYVFTYEHLNRSQLTPEDWERTISVSSAGIGPRIKKLKMEEKEKLMNSGKEAVIEFFGREEK
jgi:NTE family protein